MTLPLRLHVARRPRAGKRTDTVSRAGLHVVLIAHDVHNGGGMERACAELIRGAPTDIEFTVVSRTLGDDLRDRVTWKRVPTPTRPFLLKYLTFFVLAGLRLLRTRPGVRHAVGAIVPNRVDVAAVHFCHAGYVTRTKRLAPAGATRLRALNTAATRIVSRLAESWCYRPGRVRALAAVSTGLAYELETHFPGVPIVITPNGVDLERFGSVAEPSRPLVPSGKPLVALFVGGDWDRKGLGPAIEGLAEARRQAGRRVELWVVGRGDERRFRHLAEQHDVSRCVRFFGFRGGVEPFYDAADVLVLPTLYEADSLVVHEAAAAGLAIVVTRVNGAEELVGDDEAGFIVDRNGQSIGSALARLALDEPLRRQQAAAARAKARAMSWERSTAGVVTLYRRLAGAPAVGDGRR